jgi:hypothetical protein
VGHMLDLSNRNRALSPSICADSRDVSWPDIISFSLSQTCHSHCSGFRAVSFTSSRRDRGAFAIQRICAPASQFSSPELCHNQTDGRLLDLSESPVRVRFPGCQVPVDPGQRRARQRCLSLRGLYYVCNHFPREMKQACHESRLSMTPINNGVRSCWYSSLAYFTAGLAGKLWRPCEGSIGCGPEERGADLSPRPRLAVTIYAALRERQGAAGYAF